jgi:hypothetical protein
MAKLVNLRTARKQKVRDAKVARLKGAPAAEKARTEKAHEGHRLKKDD